MLVSISVYVNDEFELKDPENIKALYYIGEYLADEIQDEYTEDKTEYHMEYQIGEEDDEDETDLDDIDE